MSVKLSLISYLERQKNSGKSHINLGHESKTLLRSFFLQKKNTPPIKKAVVQPQLKAAASPNSDQTIAPKVLTATTTTVLPQPTFNRQSSKNDQLKELSSQAENWTPAKSLGTLRDKMVFSAGTPEADIMLVGEAPGFQEERQGEPFVGPAGDKLDGILKAMGLSRDKVYISNIVKFRPAMKGQTTNNRKPTPEEIASCLPFIKAEVDIIKPKLIIALGGSAAEGLLQVSEAVGKLRGSWHEFSGLPLRVSYHPSYLLHNDSALSEKRKVWEDMLAVMEKLDLPISEKQRNFFRK